jgi:hypothetical protein
MLNNSATDIWSALNGTQVVATPSSVLAAIASSQSSADAAADSSAASASAASASMTAGGDGDDDDLALSSSGSLTGPTRTVAPSASASASVAQARLLRRQATATLPQAGGTAGGAITPPKPTAATYLIALLGNVGASYAQANSTTSGTSSTGSSGGGGGPNTGLAMIILVRCARRVSNNCLLTRRTVRHHRLCHRPFPHRHPQRGAPARLLLQGAHLSGRTGHSSDPPPRAIWPPRRLRRQRTWRAIQGRRDHPRPARFDPDHQVFARPAHRRD